MEQHTLNKGFTLVEMLLVVACVSVISIIYLPIHRQNTYEEYVWPYMYLETQAIAIRHQTPTQMQPIENYQGPWISFNDAGNVKQAQTIHFPSTDIVIELGGGHLVFKKRNVSSR